MNPRGTRNDLAPTRGPLEGPAPRSDRSAAPGDPARTRRALRSVAAVRPALGIAAFLLSAALLACGGSPPHLNVSLERSASHDKPIYVGVFYLSQENAIDAADIPDLIDAPETFTEGVVERQVLPVYPGEARTIPMPSYDPAIRWVAFVADFEDAGPCARVKQAVAPGSKLDLVLAVEEKCLEIR